MLVKILIMFAAFKHMDARAQGFIAVVAGCAFKGRVDILDDSLRVGYNNRFINCVDGSIKPCE